MSRLDQAKNAAVAALTRRKAAKAPTCASLRADEDRLRKRREAKEAQNATRRQAAENRLDAKQAAERAKLTGRLEREIKGLASEFGCAPRPQRVSKASTPKRLARAPRPDYVRGEFRVHLADRFVAIDSPFVADVVARTAKDALLQGEGFHWSDEAHRWRRKASKAAWTAAIRVVDQLAAGLPAAVAEAVATTAAKAKILERFEFDGTRCTIFVRPAGYAVEVVEGGFELTLNTLDGADLFEQANRGVESLRVMSRGSNLDTPVAQERRRMLAWTADRVAYVFSLAARRIAVARKDPRPVELGQRLPPPPRPSPVATPGQPSLDLTRLNDGRWIEVDEYQARLHRSQKALARGEPLDPTGDYGVPPKTYPPPLADGTPGRPDYVVGGFRAQWTELGYDSGIGKLHAPWKGTTVVAIYVPHIANVEIYKMRKAALLAAGFRWSAEEGRYERKASEAAWSAAVKLVDELAVALPPKVVAVVSPGAANEPQKPDPIAGRVYGKATEVVLTSARGALKVIPARFVLMSARDLIPSHDSQTFDPRPDYPEGVQERRYEVDRNEQIKVTGVAQDMHPGLLQSTSTGAVDGTPVIAAGGAAVVLGGNGRSMGAQRHYKSGRTILRDYVVEHAGEFGITAAQARRLEDPIVVREVDVPRAEWPRMVRDLNVTLTQTMDADTEAAAQARQLPADVLRTLATGLAQGELGEFLRSRASLGLVGALERSGFINRSNRGRMVADDGLLSREATLQLERQLLSLLVPDTALLERLGLEIRGTLARSAPVWLAAAANGPKWDLREPLLAALGDLRTMRHDNQCLAQWLQQTSFGRSTTSGSMGRLLLEILDLAGGKPVIFAKVARAYFEASSGGGLFGGGVEPMQALSEAAMGAGINPASAISKKRCKR